MHLRPSLILPCAPPSLQVPESPKSQDKPWPCSGPLYCTHLSTDRLHVVHVPLASQMVPHTIWVHWIPSSAVLQAHFIPRHPFASHGHALGPSKALNPPSQNVVSAWRFVMLIDLINRIGPCNRMIDYRKQKSIISECTEHSASFAEVQL